MENYIKYILFFIIAILIYLVYSRIFSFINNIRINRGLKYKIRIIITNDKTELSKENDQQIYWEPNIVLYTSGNNHIKKLLLIGSSGKLDEMKNKYKNKTLIERNFIDSFKEVIEDMNDFWYQYVTYFSHKYKNIMGLPFFSIPSISLKVVVYPDEIKSKIQHELDKLKVIKKPKLYNIIDIE